MKLVLGLAAAAAVTLLPPSHGVAQIPVLGAECFGLEATIVGTEEDDVIEGTAGDDVIAALAGDDRIRGLSGGDAICAGDGADEVDGGRGGDGVAVGRGADVARGGAGRDLIVEFSSDSCGPCPALDPRSRDVSADVISGGPGHDALGAEGGNDSIAGGEGRDLSLFLSRFSSVTIDLSLGRAVSTAGGVDELSGIEHALGSIHSDVIRGNNRPNTLIGLWGQDVIDGSGGGDWIYAGFSGSVLNGGEDESQDTIALAWSEPSLVDLAAGVATGRGDSAYFTPDTVVRFENVHGGTGDDIILGDGSPNFLEGGFGHDEVNGRTAGDYVFGEYAEHVEPWAGAGMLPGNDALDGGEGKDHLDGGPLIDECVNGERYVACERRDGESRSFEGRSGAARLPWWWERLDYAHLHESPAVADLLVWSR